MNKLGKISVMGFPPETAKRGHEMTERKEKLRNEFQKQNQDELPDLIKNCINKESIGVDVIFKLNTNVPNPTTFKKDLDNLLKILLDIFPEEMDDNTKERGLGIIRGNEDDRVHEIICRKDFVEDPKDEGIIVEFYEFVKN